MVARKPKPPTETPSPQPEPTVNIAFTQARAQLLANLLDEGAKAHGLNYARAALTFVDELQAAFAAQPPSGT